ncbi:MAG: DUF1080 domain-containing protein [Kiritimatiellia bacterium]|jgi:hypothetical protein|nr:DUF1080 domain-containing protein [Kiritimatiellia bacterium]
MTVRKRIDGLIGAMCLLLVLTGATGAFGEGEWVSLFDGKTLEGWTPAPGGKWEVKDGAIVGTSPRSERRHGVLLSNKEYGDFKVILEFKSVKGNSGFYFRSQRVEHAVAVAGFQAEINPGGQDVGGLYETQGRAWVIKPPAAVIKKAFKAGDWNEMTVEAVGKDVTVYLNGAKTSELKNDKGRLKGVFGLQLHGGAEMYIEFRNIRIKELSAVEK